MTVRRFLVRSSTLVAVALTAVLGLSGPSSADTAQASKQPTLVAETCYGWFEGPREKTDFRTEQMLVWQHCRQTDGKYTIRAQVEFTPLLGFAASHVTGCRVHIKLTHVGGSAQDKNVDCTAKARAGTDFWSEPLIVWTGVGPGQYVLSGWVNIYTTRHYEGSRFASTEDFWL